MSGVMVKGVGKEMKWGHLEMKYSEVAWKCLMEILLHLISNSLPHHFVKISGESKWLCPPPQKKDTMWLDVFGRCGGGLWISWCYGGVHGGGPGGLGGEAKATHERPATSDYPILASCHCAWLHAKPFLYVTSFNFHNNPARQALACFLLNLCQ